MRTTAGTTYEANQLGGTAAAVANYIALSTNSTAPAAADTTLAGELAAASGGLIRAVATFAYTSPNTYYTLSKTFTANANDGSSNTIQKIGVFNAASAGTLFFETAVPNPPTLVSGDSVAITETVNI
ncbi:MAG: hypothetical protein NVS3B1_21340 [Marmoricola sp.]